ncbi:hypothetical protein AOLI_G00106360 [Acnodon oligacanthus]
MVTVTVHFIPLIGRKKIHSVLENLTVVNTPVEKRGGVTLRDRAQAVLRASPQSWVTEGDSVTLSCEALVVMLAKAMKRAVYGMCLVFFSMFIFAVAGILTHNLDSWVDLLRKVDGLGVAYSRLFPIIFILMGHFIFFNMFVGLVIMEVERMTKAREEESLQVREAAQKRKKKRTMKQLIGSQVSKLKKWSDTNVRTDENFPQIIKQLRMSLSDSDHIVTKDKSSSLTFLQLYLTMLQHQDATLDKLQQIYDEMQEVLSELLKL